MAKLILGSLFVEQGNTNTLLDVGMFQLSSMLAMQLNASFLNVTQTATASPSICINRHLQRGSAEIWGLLLAPSV